METDSWLSGTIVALRYRESDWTAGFCAAYQVRLDVGLLIFSPEDSSAMVRAIGGQPHGRLVLESHLNCCPPLGQIETNWPHRFKAHQMVEMLCASAKDVGLWRNEFKVVVQDVITPGLPGAKPDSIEQVEKRVGRAGLQALIAWEQLDGVFQNSPAEGYLAVLCRPETLSMLCQWIAYPPNFGPPIDRTCSTCKLKWSYTGDYKDPNSFKSMRGGIVVLLPGGVPDPKPLRLSPPQFSMVHMRVRVSFLCHG
jgi:hypothetical protein